MQLKTEKIFFLILAFVVLFILGFNIIHYTPLLGYDAEAHINYVDHLSRYLPDRINLPSDNDSREFFNPPIGYLVPSFFQILCRNTIESSDFLNDCRPFYSFYTQIFQSFMYLLTILINLKILKNFNKQNTIFNLAYLLLISLTAVNYRTISMIRGEPYIVFFLSILLYYLHQANKNEFSFDLRKIFIVGLAIGGIALSRQWGFLLFPPLVLIVFHKTVVSKKNYMKFILSSFFIGFIFSSWFYFNLFFQYGSFTAFNLKRMSFSFSNKPVEFYVPTFENMKYLFYKPIRPYLDNQFITTLYSDLWGDYWGYFTFTSIHLDIGRNQKVIGDYLANVNTISLVSTLIIIYLYYKTCKLYKNSFFVKYLNFAVIFTFLGYMWFLLSIYEPTGDTIKATYLLQVFHLIAFIASIYLNKLKVSQPNLYKITVLILCVTFIFNFQTYLSHYPVSFIEDYRF